MSWEYNGPYNPAFSWNHRIFSDAGHVVAVDYGNLGTDDSLKNALLASKIVYRVKF